ncbi:MAG: ATP-binding domain-containing protein [Bacteroides sp.]|nr:ATP-binding domain-containing protein [Bacteroides sp.]MCM1094857.1 ATP-binding domain-containing protein [Terasakiella sp.]
MYSKCQATTTYESKEEYDKIKEKKGNFAQMVLDLKAVRRVSKVHFTTDTANLKFATIPSFKGWESKNVILLLQKDFDDVKNCEEDGFRIQAHENNEALIYTAITRARENIFILNLGDEKSHQFFYSRIQNEI